MCSKGFYNLSVYESTPLISLKSYTPSLLMSICGQYCNLSDWSSFWAARTQRNYWFCLALDKSQLTCHSIILVPGGSFYLQSESCEIGWSPNGFKLIVPFSLKTHSGNFYLGILWAQNLLRRTILTCLFPWFAVSPEAYIAALIFADNTRNKSENRAEYFICYPYSSWA